VLHAAWNRCWRHDRIKKDWEKGSWVRFFGFVFRNANPYKEKFLPRKKKKCKNFLKKTFCWFRLVRYDKNDTKTNKKSFLRCKKSFKKLFASSKGA
jgi:hypothetical protein